jgi:hypothetical protein
MKLSRFEKPGRMGRFVSVDNDEKYELTLITAKV